MKKYSSLPLLLLVLLGLSACAEKKTGSTVNNTYVQNPVTGSTGTTDSTGTTGTTTGGVTGCSDGVARAGATKCYYTNLDTLVFSGPGTVGPIYWSSATDLPGHISPNQFRTDASFAVRVKPIVADGGSSRQGRSCSQFTKNNFSKLQVKVMLRRSGDSLGEVKTLTGEVNKSSNTARFTVPGGTTEPYILEVVSVLSNHRCNAAYGSAPSGCPNAYFDIPVVSNTNYTTECVAFNIEYATDDTYDLPN